MSYGQRAWSRTATGWTPTRGRHSGIKCDVCGKVPDDIYLTLKGPGPTFEDYRKNYCKEHLPKGENG